MEIKQERKKLSEKPWLALLAIMLASVFAMYFTGFIFFGLLGLPDDQPGVRFVKNISFHLLTGFVIAPFILRLPKGKNTFRGFLEDIGLTGHKPYFRLVLLSLSCALVLGLCQAGASIVFRFFEGYPVNGRFLKQVFDFSALNPSRTPDLLLALPSIFEEVAFRGIALTVFLGKHSTRKAIIFSSIGFSLMHLFNLGSGRELIWVLGQLVWTFIMGLFYGYLFVKTQSLWPSMIVHFLSNAFVNMLTGYMITRAAVPAQVLYQIIFSFGILPVALMILWTRYYSGKWLPEGAG